MMRSTSWNQVQDRLGDLARRLSLLALLVTIAVASIGCGGGARADFQLNSGEAADSTDPIADLFPSSAADSVLSQSDGDYRIQEWDQLEIVFFTHPDQNRFIRVRPDGYLTLPYVGDVLALGKRPRDLALELQESYQDILLNPQVDILVQESGARYYVFGEVARPGEFAFQRRLDIMQALAAAGGYSDGARLTNIVLLRRDPETGGAFAAILDFRKFLAGEGRAANLQIQPYDIVWVPRSGLSRWDNSARQLLAGVLNAQDVAIRGWSLVRFSKVYENQRF